MSLSVSLPSYLFYSFSDFSLLLSISVFFSLPFLLQLNFPNNPITSHNLLPSFFFFSVPHLSRPSFFFFSFLPYSSSSAATKPRWLDPLSSLYGFVLANKPWCLDPPSKIRVFEIRSCFGTQMKWWTRKAIKKWTEKLPAIEPKKPRNWTGIYMLVPVSVPLLSGKKPNRPTPTSQNQLKTHPRIWCKIVNLNY